MNEYNSASRKKEHKSATKEEKLEMVRHIECGEENQMRSNAQMHRYDWV